VGVTVGVAVALGVAVAVAVAVGVALGVAVAVGVEVGVGLAVAVGVGVGEGAPIQTVSFCTVATLSTPLYPPAAISRLSPIAPPDGNERTASRFGELVQVSVAGS
jgi:hypothetical protein